MDSKKYAEHVVKGTALVFTIALATNVVSYLIRIFLARSLTPAEFGLVYASIAFIGLLNIFQSFGMSQTMQKKIPEFLGTKSYGKIKYAMKFSFTIQFLYAILVLIIIALFSGNIADLLKAEASSQILLVLAAAGLLYPIYHVAASTFQGLGKVKEYALLEFFSYLLRMIIVFSIISVGVLALPYAQVASLAIISVAGVILLKSGVPEIFRVRSEPVARDILSFSTPVMISLVASTIVTNFATVALSLMVSLEEAAIYQIALPVANIVMILAGSITIITLPLASEVWSRNDKKTLASITELLVKALFAVVIPVSIIFAVFPEIVVSMLFGEAYIAAAGVLRLLAIAVIFQSMVLVLSSLLLGIGRPASNARMAFVIAGMNLASGIPLIYIYGSAGAAVSLLVTYIAGLAAFLYTLRKYLKFSFQTTNIAKIFLGGMLTAALIFSIKTSLAVNPWIELIISAAVGLTFYFTFVIKTRAITKAELSILFSTGLPVPNVIKNITLKLAE